MLSNDKRPVPSSKFITLVKIKQNKISDLSFVPHPGAKNDALLLISKDKADVMKTLTMLSRRLSEPIG